jgi:hypothetical protein
MLAGDFNGDGKADIAEVYNAGGQQTMFFMHYSTGTSFNNGVLQWSSGAGAMDWSQVTPLAADVTGDHLTDIAAFEPSGVGGTKLRVWTATATGFGQPATWWDSGPYSWAFSQVNPVAGDLNGDGRTDLAVVLACCGQAQASVWKFLSTGSALSGGAPTLAWQGALGPVGTGSMSPTGTGRFQLVNAATGRCIEVSGGSTDDMTTLDQWDCIYGAGNEQFTFVPAAPDLFAIQPAHVTGKCFDVAYGGTADGTPIWQYPCNSSAAQRFQPVYLSGWGNEVVAQLVVNFDGKCVDLDAVGAANGTRIQQWTCNSTPAQQFYLRPVSTTAPNPTAAWSMDEPGEATLVDASGHNAAATLTGAAHVGGFHASFDGSSGYAHTAGPIVDTSKSFTVSAWLRMSNAGSTSQTAVAAQGTSTSGFLVQYAGDTHQWCFTMQSADAASPLAYRALAPVTVHTGVWIQLVGVFDATSRQLSLYFDGLLVSTVAGPAVPWNAAGPVTIGRGWYGGTGVNYFSGDLDDVRLWNRVLSASEIAAVYANRA